MRRTLALRAAAFAQHQPRSDCIDDPAAEREYQQDRDHEQDLCVTGAAFHAEASVAAVSAGNCSRLRIFVTCGERLPMANARSAPTATIAAPMKTAGLRPLTKCCPVP